jgi:hypothetical protein
MKKKVYLLIINMLLIITLCFTMPVYAVVSDAGNSTFKDVQEDHWAREAIQWMVEKGIAEGNGNGMFLPDDAVARDEFAKMMVLTLKLQLINPETPSFKDVEKGGCSISMLKQLKDI